MHVNSLCKKLSKFFSRVCESKSFIKSMFSFAAEG